MNDIRIVTTHGQTDSWKRLLEFIQLSVRPYLSQEKL